MAAGRSDSPLDSPLGGLLDEREREVLLASYAALAGEVAEVLGGLSRLDLERRESAKEWTVREIAHHLADVEVGDAMRLRQMAAHDSPLIVAYDEDLFASRLHYERPIASSLAVFSALRASNGELVERLEAAEWSRRGWHEEHERYTIEILVRRSIEHDGLHLAQIARALGRDA